MSSDVTQTRDDSRPHLKCTAMFVTSSSGTAYNFRAELVRGGKAEAARACSLPAKGKIFEQWDKPADAVRILNFAPAGREGRC